MLEPRRLHRLLQLGVTDTIKCLGLVNEAEVQQNIVLLSLLYHHLNVNHLLPGSSLFHKSSLFLCDLLNHISPPLLFFSCQTSNVPNSTLSGTPQRNLASFHTRHISSVASRRFWPHFVITNTGNTEMVSLFPGVICVSDVKPRCLTIFLFLNNHC